MEKKILSMYNFFLKIVSKIWFKIRNTTTSVFETKRDFIDFFLGGYALIFLFNFSYIILTEVFPSEARQYSQKVFMAWLGLPTIFATIGMFLTMGLSIYYLYRSGRAIYQAIDPRGMIPNQYPYIRTVEEYLSSWKGKNVSELVALIGEPEGKSPSGFLNHSYVWNNVRFSWPVSNLRSLVIFTDSFGNIEFYLWTCDDLGWRDPLEETLHWDMESRGEI
ncbi:MAG: hypothetical protein ABIU05_09360 [Nitrospirales bacterium]